MSVQDEVLHAPPTWFTPPAETDFLAWVAVGLIILALFGLISLYAAFDRWAEHRSSGTPLAKTIPTLLTIALLYEIFPLDHFSILLPLTAILLALVADWSRFHQVAPQGVDPGNEAPREPQASRQPTAGDPRMLELLLTSFPAVFRYYQLKRRGEAMTVWNMRTAVFAWAIMAFLLFLMIFYFHPKSYSGLLPFRTISVVAQASGPVTDIAVLNGQRVDAGDLLFRIEDSSQQARLKQAEAEFDKIAALETKARDTLKVASASEASASASLEKLLVDRDNARQLLARNVGTQDAVRQIEASVAVAEAERAAAEAQVDLARSDISQAIPAQRKAAEAALQNARADLAKTEVRAFSDGLVTQLALSVGSPASTLILSPAMVIIPDRQVDLPVRFIAGFDQVARSTLHVGMPAEIACNTNINLSFRDTILPARISEIQPAISSGQVVPGSRLLDAENMSGRGSLLAYLELVYPEHEKIMIDGSGCLVQTYTDNLDGIFGHVIAATGVVKAVGLRLKVWGALVSGVGLGGGGH